MWTLNLHLWLGSGVMLPRKDARSCFAVLARPWVLRQTLYLSFVALKLQDRRVLIWAKFVAGDLLLVMWLRPTYCALLRSVC